MESRRSASQKRQSAAALSKSPFAAASYVDRAKGIIEDLRVGSLSRSEIADKWGVSPHKVTQIKMGRLFPHLDRSGVPGDARLRGRSSDPDVVNAARLSWMRGESAAKVGAALGVSGCAVWRWANGRSRRSVLWPSKAWDPASDKRLAPVLSQLAENRRLIAWGWINDFGVPPRSVDDMFGELLVWVARPGQLSQALRVGAVKWARMRWRDVARQSYGRKGDGRPKELTASWDDDRSGGPRHLAEALSVATVECSPATKIDVHYAIDQLPSRLASVVRARLAGYTLTEAGRSLGVTQARAWQLEREAHRHLAAALGDYSPSSSGSGPQRDRAA